MACGLDDDVHRIHDDEVAHTGMSHSCSDYNTTAAAANGMAADDVLSSSIRASGHENLSGSCVRTSRTSRSRYYRLKQSMSPAGPEGKAYPKRKSSSLPTAGNDLCQSPWAVGCNVVADRDHLGTQRRFVTATPVCRLWT